MLMFGFELHVFPKRERGHRRSGTFSMHTLSSNSNLGQMWTTAISLDKNIHVTVIERAYALVSFLWWIFWAAGIHNGYSIICVNFNFRGKYFICIFILVVKALSLYFLCFVSLRCICHTRSNSQMNTCHRPRKSSFTYIVLCFIVSFVLFLPLFLYPLHKKQSEMFY